MAIGLSVYAGYVTETLPGTSDRNVAKSAIQDVWNKIQRSGVYPAEDELGDIYSTSDPSGLPEGYYVYVNITRTEAGDSSKQELFEHAGDERSVVFGPQGAQDPASVRSEVEGSLGVPDSASTASRPIPIQRGRGDVVAGRLHVAAWEQ